MDEDVEAFYEHNIKVREDRSIYDITIGDFIALLEKTKVVEDAYIKKEHK